MTPKQADRLIKLAKDLYAIIYKYQRYIKPSEADKARKVNKILKQIEYGNRNNQKDIS